LFGQEKEQKTLEGIFANVFQSAFGEDVYSSIESKATHLLYFIVKNHPFNDGNKRSGAFAFIRFLKQTGHAMTGITPEALTALTLLVAASDPKEKEKVVSLIMLLLQPL
jgi:prophage maintenance system killer protein